MFDVCNHSEALIHYADAKHAMDHKVTRGTFNSTWQHYKTVKELSHYIRLIKILFSFQT